MRGADVISSEHTPPDIIPERGQIGEDLTEPMAAEQSGDVFEKSERGPDDAEDAGDVGPAVAFVLGSKLLAGDAVGLAGESAAQDIDAPDPVGGIEVVMQGAEALDGAHVAVDGEGRQQAVALAGGEDGAGVGVDVDGSDAGMAEDETAEDAATAAGE